MNKNWLLLLFGVLVLQGCHTIRPSGAPTVNIIEAVPKIHKNAALILDESYRTYVSKERGNALADPQTYHVGAALAPLTEAYFETSFDELKVYDRMPAPEAVGGIDLILHPHLDRFENAVRLTDQTITFFMSADLYNGNGVPRGKVQARGFAQRDLGLFDSSNKAAVTVNLAIQNALMALIREVKNTI